MPISMDLGTHREVAKKGIAPHEFYGYSGHRVETGLEGQGRKRKYLIGDHLHGPGKN